MGKMEWIWHFACALPASIWGHCSQVLVFTSTWGASGFLGTPKFRAEKTMTATDVTGFDAIFSTGVFSPDFRGLVLLIAHKYWRKAKKSSGEPPVETAPRNSRFLSPVVVELVLKNTAKQGKRENDKSILFTPSQGACEGFQQRQGS